MCGLSTHTHHSTPLAPCYQYTLIGLHILLPLIPDLLVALTLEPMLGKRRGYLMLYMPDYSWLAMICGSFALVWSFLRTGLVLGAIKSSPSQTIVGRLT